MLGADDRPSKAATKSALDLFQPSLGAVQAGATIVLQPVALSSPWMFAVVAA